MTQCLDLRCCIIQIWIGLLIIFRLPNTNCFGVSLVLVRHLSFGKKCNEQVWSYIWINKRGENLTASEEKCKIPIKK